MAYTGLAAAAAAVAHVIGREGPRQLRRWSSYGLSIETASGSRFHMIRHRNDAAHASHSITTKHNGAR